MEEVKVNQTQSVATQEPALPARANELFAPGIALGRWFHSSPFALMRELTDEMERAFRDAGHRMNAGGLMAWSPTVDVRQCNGNMVVTAELPGLKKDEVKVEVSDEGLVIQGERKREREADQGATHLWERSYGKFYRLIPLPEGAKTDQAKAELEDGVLKISVPVPQVETKSSREVPIQTVAAAKG